MADRLELTTDPFLTRTIRAVIKTFDQQIQLIEAESAEVIAQHQQLERTYAILTSVPGVGPVTAAVLMVVSSRLFLAVLYRARRAGSLALT